MGIAEKLGGLPALAAVFAVTTGILGAALGKYVLDACRVRDWRARGFALGLAAHGIGTARAFQVNARCGRVRRPRVRAARTARGDPVSARLLGAARRIVTGRRAILRSAPIAPSAASRSDEPRPVLRDDPAAPRARSVRQPAARRVRAREGAAGAPCAHRAARVLLRLRDPARVHGRRPHVHAVAAAVRRVAVDRRRHHPVPDRAAHGVPAQGRHLRRGARRRTLSRAAGRAVDRRTLRARDRHADGVARPRAPDDVGARAVDRDGGDGASCWSRRDACRRCWATASSTRSSG